MPAPTLYRLNEDNVNMVYNTINTMYITHLPNHKSAKYVEVILHDTCGGSSAA